jgi:tetratricopeptide (TPR) repeat protein
LLLDAVPNASVRTQPFAWGDVMADRAASTEKLNVFISYSRDDIGFADQLDATLRIGGFATTLDRHGIDAGEDWSARLGALIRDADTVAFVLTPRSAASKICAWEVEEAVRLGKRILPVLPGPLGASISPPGLAALNYILFYDEPKKPGSGFGPGLLDLVTALKTDLPWLREHTRLLQRASEWDSVERAENRLLSGADIQSAKDWAARRPKDAPAPTGLQLDFIRASENAQARRQSEERRRLEEMAAANTERQRALAEAETALRKASTEANRRARTQWLLMLTASAAVVAVVGGGIAWRSFGQTQAALARNERMLDKVMKRTSNLVAIGTSVDQYGAPVKLGRALLDEARGVIDDISEIEPTSRQLPVRRTEMLLGFADSYAKLGRPADQLKAAVEARDIMQEAAAAKPDDLSLWHSLANSWLRVGDGHSAQRELVAALGAYDAAIAIRERHLGGVESSDFEWLSALESAHQSRAVALNRRDNPQNAKAALDRAVAVVDRLEAVGADPHLVAQRRVAALIQLANIERSMGARQLALPLVDKALQVTQRIRRERFDDASWQRREASLYVVRCDVLRDLKNFDSAMASCESALKLRSGLSANDPEHASIAAEFAYASIKVGELLSRQRELSKAEAAFRSAAEIYESQLRARPDNFSAARQLFDALDGLGDLHERLQQWEPMRQTYDRKLQLALRIQEKDPANRDTQRLVATARLSMGDAYSSLGRSEEAEKEFRTALEIRRQLAKETSNFSDLRQLAGALESLGETLVKRDALPEAREVFGEALTIRSTFAEAPEADNRARQQLTTLQEQLAILNLKLGQPQAALELLQPAVEARRHQNAGPNTNEIYQRDLASVLETLGRARMALADPPAALAASSESLPIRRRLLEADPASAQKTVNLAAALHLQGRAHRAIGNCAEARAALTSARDYLDNAISRNASNPGWSHQRTEILSDLAVVEKQCPS